MPFNPFLIWQMKVPEGITISERFVDKLKAKIKPLHIFIIQCECIKKLVHQSCIRLSSVKGFFSIDSALNDLRPQSHGWNFMIQCISIAIINFDKWFIKNLHKSYLIYRASFYFFTGIDLLVEVLNCMVLQCMWLNNS